MKQTNIDQLRSEAFEHLERGDLTGAVVAISMGFLEQRSRYDSNRMIAGMQHAVQGDRVAVMRWIESFVQRKGR